MREFLIVGIGGFFGSCARYSISKAVALSGVDFPLATLLSNVTAGFIIGFIFGIESAHPALLSAKTKLLLKTGVLGGLSTFSAFSLETVSLFTDKRFFAASSNVILNVTLSLGGVLLGMACALHGTTA